MNLSSVAALSGVAPSTRFSLLMPGTLGSANRFSTSVRASGDGSAPAGAATTEFGAPGAVGDAGAAVFESPGEHPDSPIVATAAAEINAKNRYRGPRRKWDFPITPALSITPTQTGR